MYPKKVTSLLSLPFLFIHAASGAEPKVDYVSERGFVVTNSISTQAPPDVVWQALVTAVDEWWPKDHSWWNGTFSIDPVAGGCFCEVSGIRSAEHMRISLVDPEKLLRMTGGLGPLQGMGLSGALDWTLTQTDNGTQVLLTYRVSGDNKDGFEQLAPVVAKVQGLQLDGLGNYLSRERVD